MPRALKPQKASTVRDPRTDIEHTIYFDRNDLDFFVELAEGVIIRGDDVKECRKRALERLEDMVSYDWKPVIIIKGPPLEEESRTIHYGYRDEDNWFMAKVDLWFRRAERSPHPGGEKHKIVERVMREDFPPAWNEEGSFAERKRKAWAEGSETLNVWNAPRDIVLPYTPELWEILIRMRESVLSANARLETLLKLGQTNKAMFLEALTRGGVPLLGAAPAEVVEEDVPLRSARRK